MVKPGDRTPQWVEEELKDGDRLCEAAGVQRTEGGRLNVAKIVNALREQGKAQRAEEAPTQLVAGTFDALHKAFGLPDTPENQAKSADFARRVHAFFGEPWKDCAFYFCVKREKCQHPDECHGAGKWRVK